MPWVLVVFVLSFLYPLLVAFKSTKIKSDPSLTLAWLILVLGLIVSLVFAESGGRFNHGNFFWQVYISAFVLFLVSVKHDLENVISIRLSEVRNWNLLQWAYVGHFTFGCVYLFKVVFFSYI